MMKKKKKAFNDLRVLFSNEAEIKPSQNVPFPKKPSRQEHSKEATVFLQVAWG